jgi:hypothetical protein
LEPLYPEWVDHFRSFFVIRKGILTSDVTIVLGESKH